MTPGKLIVFEGIDGCGKSTQLALASSMLRARGVDVMCTRQPTSRYRRNPAVRAYLDAGNKRVGMEALCRLAAGDRLRHVDEEIVPALKRGTWVLSDRYVYSSYAFFRARGLELAYIRRANEGVRRPDVTFLLDMAPEDARKRVLAREGAVTKYEEKDLGFMGIVRETFLGCRDESYVILDARLGTDALHAAVVSAIDRGLSPFASPE